ncbi:MAG: sigma-70 family RNA polymerase sigma factor [Deltaproteobacteria bacterium]|nr:sigma-70 family RNA polymerase sigma factor [Deltaproteobacteria bacterium]
MGSRSGASGAEVTDQLVPFVYEELRKMARRQLAGERHQQTLNTTGLVHEAYLKLVDHTQVSERGRSYFFAAAACAMRQVLVDAARRRNRLKRGAGLRPEPLEEARLELEGFTARVLHLEEALEALAAEFPRQAQVVECRFFGGLTVVETSQALDISPRTVKGDWALARAWLFRALQSPS